MIEVGTAPREHHGWIGARANLILTPAFRAIEAVDGDRILGMVGYDGWTPNSCSMHMAIDEPIAIRKLLRPAFEVPFQKYGFDVVFGSVLSNNPKALKIDLHLGFKEVCFLPDAWAKGVGIHLLQMRREECRYLRERVTTATVNVLTHCKDPKALYGSILTFKTLRTGFPTANVVVVDNASHPEVRKTIRSEARRCGADFVQLENEINHHDFVGRVIYDTKSGPAVIIDPDMVFWDSVEGFGRFGGDELIAGRLIPEYRCEYTQTITRPRLHTSFLWIADVARLRERIDNLRRIRFDWHPFAPVQFQTAGEWQRFDVGASLFAAMPEIHRAFTEEDLDAFDHLFVGSHLQIVAPRLAPEDAARMTKLHESAKVGDIGKLRGIWRWQDDFFRRRASVTQKREVT